MSQVTHAEKIATAFTIAFDAHNGQKRDDGTPYIAHSVRVMEILTDELGVVDTNTLCAALLHDVVEDTEVSYEELLEKMGLEVELMVKLLTKTGLTKEQYYSNLSQASESVRLIKCADRLDNIRDMKTWNEKRRAKYLAETREYVIPLAEKTNAVLLQKLRELV